MRALLSAALALLCGAAAAQATPAGLWKTYSDRSGLADGLVRIVEVDGAFEGTVEKVFSPPAADPDPRCEDCPGEFKDKPVIGLKILRGLRPNRAAPAREGGQRYSGGEILDPDDGKVYRCSAKLLDGGRTLELRGYVGIELFGRTQVWRREE